MYAYYGPHMYSCVCMWLLGALFTQSIKVILLCAVYTLAYNMEYTLLLEIGQKKFEPIEVCVHKVHVRCFGLRTRDHFKILEALLTVRATLQNTMGLHPDTDADGFIARTWKCLSLIKHLVVVGNITESVTAALFSRIAAILLWIISVYSS